MEYGSPYTDTRYAYYRNEPLSTACLYTYVKYEGDSECYDGEPHDYPLNYEALSCPDDHHPHAIDLGLPSGTKWACCNLGAEQPTDFGEYYLGDFSSKDVIDALGSNYDVPTLEQFKELETYCSYSVATRNDVQGVEFTGTNGNTIFLPLAASYCWYDSYEGGGWEINNAGTASYWTKTPSSSNYTHFMEFYYTDYYQVLCWGDRKTTTNKMSIRPVFVSNSVDNISSVQIRTGDRSLSF